MTKHPFKKSEKWLLVTTLVGIALLLTAGFWRYSVEGNPQVAIPAPKMPSTNAYDFYVKAGALYEAAMRATPNYETVDPAVDTRSMRSLSAQQIAQLYPTAAKEVWLDRNAAALDTLRQGFAYPYRQPAVRSAVLSAPSPPYTQFRMLVRLLLIESHARAERGDRAEAAQSYLDILHMGHDMPRGGGEMAALVGSSMDALAFREFYDLVPQLGAATARTTALEIEKLEAGRFTVAETMQEEKWIGEAELLELLRDPDWRAKLDNWHPTTAP